MNVTCRLERSINAGSLAPVLNDSFLIAPPAMAGTAFDKQWPTTVQDSGYVTDLGRCGLIVEYPKNNSPKFRVDYKPSWQN